MSVTVKCTRCGASTEFATQPLAEAWSRDHACDLLQKYPTRLLARAEAARKKIRENDTPA